MKDLFKHLFFTFLFLFAILLTGCGRESDSPEEQVRLFVSAGEEAAENQDTAAIKKLISENYSDERNRVKKDLIRITAGYFLRHKNIHILSRISETSFPQPDTANVQIYVAMADLPFTDMESLLNLRADLYLFDMMLQLEKKKWRLVKASWRPAMLEDFSGN